MYAAILPVFFALALHDDPTVVTEEATLQEADVVRFYDLSTMPFSYQPEGDALAMSLVPHVEFNTADERNNYAEVDQDMEVNSVVDLIEQLYGDEFEYAGRRLQLSDRGRMVVRAPEAVHGRVASLLAFLDGSVNAQTRVRVDVVGGLQASMGTVPDGSVISAVDADSWIATAARGGRHKSYEVVLRADRPNVLDLSREVQVVLDYDVEIAQASAIADPIVGTASVGTRMAMRGAATEEGLALALAWKRGDVISLKDKDLDLSMFISASEKPTAFVAAFSVLQNLEVMTRSFALNTMIPRGKAIVLQSVVDLHRGSASEIVILRQVGADLPTLRRLPLNDEGAELILADLGTLAVPALSAVGTSLLPGYVPRDSRAHLWTSGDLEARSTSWNADMMIELLFDSVEYLSVEHTGRWLVGHSQLHSFEERKAEQLEEQKQLLAGLADMRARPELLDLTVTVSRPGSRASAPLRARVPVRLGESCSMAIGIEDSEVADYDVEVAQFASIGDPRIHWLFDGLAIWIKPSLDVNGQLVLDVRGGVHLLTGRERFDLGGVISDFVEQSEFVHLFVNEVQRLEASANGEWRATFGDRAESGSTDALRMEIVVRR